MRSKLLLIIAGILVVNSLTIFLIVYLSSFASSSRTQIRHHTKLALVIAQDQKEVHKPIKIFSVGDIMLGRNVQNQMTKNGQEYPFAKIAGLFKEQDLVMANLEGPLIKNAPVIPTGSMLFGFNSSSASLLKNNYISVVSLANNHTDNYGQKGLVSTREYLQQAGVEYFGAPAAEAESDVLIKTVGQKQFVFLGFNATYPIFNQKVAVNLVKKFASSSNAFVIVMMHWGDEYQLRSNAKQQELAHKLIDAGASVIIGSHPHVVQEVEKYNNKLIFYSLGNFIFDQYFSTDTQQGLGVGLTFQEGSTQYSLVPITIPLSQPQVMDASSSKSFLQQLAKRSEAGLRSEINNGLVVIKQ